MVDLRNHGRSSRAPAGFGARESRDIAALVEQLQVDGRLPPPVYLFGVSYGAATALFAEPLLRERIAGIVAMESYANAGDGVRGVIARMQARRGDRSEEHTSELQSLMRISYAVFCLKK